MSATQIESPRSPKAAAKVGSNRIAPQYRRNGSSKGNFEMLAWLFMRLSGVVLVVLIFGHLTVNLLVGEGIKAIDFGFVAGKWADPFWQIWDLAMLWLAMLHGTNGVRTIINDYAEKDATRLWLKIVLYAATTAIIILGTLVIFTFDPCPVVNGVQLPGGFCPAPERRSPSSTRSLACPVRARDFHEMSPSWLRRPVLLANFERKSVWYAGP